MDRPTNRKVNKGGEVKPVLKENYRYFTRTFYRLRYALDNCYFKWRC